jgi:hypothetical protein
MVVTSAYSCRGSAALAGATEQGLLSNTARHGGAAYGLFLGRWRLCTRLFTTAARTSRGGQGGTEPGFRNLRRDCRAAATQLVTLSCCADPTGCDGKGPVGRRWA